MLKMAPNLGMILEEAGRAGEDENTYHDLDFLLANELFKFLHDFLSHWSKTWQNNEECSYQSQEPLL